MIVNFSDHRLSKQNLVFRFNASSIKDEEKVSDIEAIIIDEDEKLIGDPIPLETLISLANIPLNTKRHPSTMERFSRTHAEIKIFSKTWPTKLYIYKQHIDTMKIEIIRSIKDNGLRDINIYLFLYSDYIKNTFTRSR